MSLHQETELGNQLEIKRHLWCTDNIQYNLGIIRELCMQCRCLTKLSFHYTLLH